MRYEPVTLSHASHAAFMTKIRSAAQREADARKRLLDSATLSSACGDVLQFLSRTVLRTDPAETQVDSFTIGLSRRVEHIRAASSKMEPTDAEARATLGALEIQMRELSALLMRGLPLSDRYVQDKVQEIYLEATFLLSE